MRARAIPFLVVCSVALLSTGCGLKGPLYLPDDKAQAVKRQNEKKLPFPVKQPANTSAPPAVDSDRPATLPPGT